MGEVGGLKKSLFALREKMTLVEKDTITLGVIGYVYSAHPFQYTQYFGKKWLVSINFINSLFLTNMILICLGHKSASKQITVFDWTPFALKIYWYFKQPYYFWTASLLFRVFSKHLGCFGLIQVTYTLKASAPLHLPPCHSSIVV